MAKLHTLAAGWRAKPEVSRRLVAFGSSNTELSWHSEGRHNWVDWLSIQLRDQIGRHVTVVNQGIGGETSKDLLARIKRDVLSFQPDAVIVTIGGNDALQGMTLADYRANLRDICARLLDGGTVPILQTYYCPFYEEGEAQHPEFRAVFESFVDANRELAAELDLALIDQYKAFEIFYDSDRGVYRRLMNDWMHVNRFGNLFMGLHACRAFGLPDFPYPAYMREDAQAYAHYFRRK